MPTMSCFKMTNKKTNPNNTPPTGKTSHLQRQKLEALLNSDTTTSNNQEDDAEDMFGGRDSSASGGSSTPNYSFNNIQSTPPSSGNTSPYYMSPWNQASPYTKSPWITQHYPPLESLQEIRQTGLIGSLFREEGNIYALATSGDLLYTGTESKNIRVWKKFEEFSGFKSNSGLVKAIVVLGEKIFTGHQDGKIRVWKSSGKKRKSYKRVGSLPTAKDYLASSINPNNYVQVRRHQNVPWIKHFDTVSCMAIDADGGLLYSGSWDKTVKVWRLSDSKCIESIKAHDDAVNTVVVGFDGLILTGSADGTVNVWKKELIGNHIEHVLATTLLNKENAVTSLAVNLPAATVYAGSSDGLVNYWEGEKHFFTQGGILRGHKSAVLCLAVGGERLVVSGSADKNICVWRREDEGAVHTLLNLLTGHGGPVKCLAVEQERGDNDQELAPPAEEMGPSWLVYSGSLDKSVKIWRVPENVQDQFSY